MRKKYKCPWENLADATVAESRRLRPPARRHGIPTDTLRTCLKCLELFQVHNRAMGDIPGKLTGWGGGEIVHSSRTQRTRKSPGITPAAEKDAYWVPTTWGRRTVWGPETLSTLLKTKTRDSGVAQCLALA